jgi:hypothetical protein
MRVLGFVIESFKGNQVSYPSFIRWVDFFIVYFHGLEIDTGHPSAQFSSSTTNFDFPLSFAS